MTAWDWLEVVAFVGVFWAVFKLGTIWREDHPRYQRDEPIPWDGSGDFILTHGRPIKVRQGPYDWSQES